MKFYQPRAAVIDGFTFDWQRYRIPRPAAEVTDAAQLLALEVATQALRDAGYTDKSVPKDRTAVYIGNTNTGEQTRSLAMGLRWPFVERAAALALRSHGDAAPILQAMKEAYLSVFPEPNEDVGAGSISATIAGRICNHYDFHGGAYALDGACASSLIAAINGCIALERGDSDLVLCGGVDITLDPLELVAFSRAGALSKTEMRPFDDRANGFVPGEGCGFVVLKRLADAEANQDRIYAVLRGWGTSTDGRGGMMEPTVVGQTAAISRAYEHAPYGIGDVDFFEAHGTGTKKGDATEIRSIVQVLEAAGRRDRKVPVSSSKATIGHTKAAAGIAGLIRATMAVNRRVVPPTAHCDVPNEVFTQTRDAVYPAVSGGARDAGERLIAGVNAFGFGGINAHITLESGPAPDERIRPAVDERVLLTSFQQRELFLLAAPDAAGLRAVVAGLLGEASRMSSGDLTDLAAHLAGQAAKTAHKARAAIVAGSAEELSQALEETLQKLDTAPAKGAQALSREAGWIGLDVAPGRLGFVYAGQGSQVVGMGALLATRFAWARERIAAVQALMPQWPLLEALVFAPREPAESEDSRRQGAQALSATELAQ
ncbi:MAG TPA: beta-ketoacyl synthase N-terminal-like domain-containing protein, partial [Myxococcota bacterium]|nr:beta-ketoacyl synthase N-terminal-like domain-containing protein [Myxococcota bacterium]